MKALVKLFIIISLSIITIPYSYSGTINSDFSDEELNPEFMEDEEIDYNSNSKRSSIESRERSEYDIELKNYATARYVSTKITVEHK